MRGSASAVKSLFVAAAVATLVGCTNTLGFGTATKFGLDISQKADQTVDVSLGYDRAEVASIPAPKNEDAKKDEDTYALVGIFDVNYGNPWTLKPLTLHQFFATGWAAHEAANNHQLQEFFGRKAADLCGSTCSSTKGEQK